MKKETFILNIFGHVVSDDIYIFTFSCFDRWKRFHIHLCMLHSLIHSFPMHSFSTPFTFTQEILSEKLQFLCSNVVLSQKSNLQS